MTIRVYNTLTKQKEEFVPVHPGKANIYVCGVTPYNHPHIGNARPFVTWDVIRRFLEHEGYDVLHVQNFTDVDDKIINTANKEGVLWSDVCGRYIDAYFEVMDKLNVRRAHVYPRVSEHMEEIIETVKALIDRGYAYEMDGDVYYSVEKFEHYGELSGRNLEIQLHCTGSSTAMTVPFSELFSTQTEPPWSSAISHTSDSPSPAPPYSRLRDLSTRKKGWKMLR